MSGRLLTDEERRRFATYCRQFAESCDIMAKNFEANMQNEVGKMLAKRERARAAAYTIVADDLENTESFSVG